MNRLSVLMLCLFSCVAAGAAAPLPQLQGPVADSSQSHAFSAAAHQSVPFDLAAAGYVEEEYFLSGSARVMDWPLSPGASPQVLGEGPYTTRLLVRRPANARRFSGTVIVEPLNPSANVDLPIMWAQSYPQFIAEGIAWVGVTIKPNALRALQSFDAGRYRALSFANPRSGASCDTAQINPLSGPGTSADETGLAWDVLTQLGRLIRTGESVLVRGRVQRLYMTGQSQSAGYARTYASLFGPAEKDEQGRPLYDGYLYSGSPPWQVPLHQCRADLAEGDPRLVTPPAGVPVIELFAEGDIGTNVATRRPDSDLAPDLFRRYEIAGAAHVDPWEERSFATPADIQRAGGRPAGAAQGCTPDGVEPSDFPIRHAFNAAWRHLDDWVRRGRVPPHAPWLERVPSDLPLPPDRAFVLDASGNARGGVRSTAVDVPTVRWVGAKEGSLNCMFLGYKLPLPAGRLQQMYRSDADYLRQVKQRSMQLQREGWLTRRDRRELLEEAARGLQ